MTSIAPAGGDDKEGARDLIFKLLGKGPGPGQGEGKSVQPSRPPPGIPARPPPGIPSTGREEGKVLLDFLKNKGNSAETQPNRDREKEALLKSVLFGGGGGKEESASTSATNTG